MKLDLASNYYFSIPISCDGNMNLSIFSLDLSFDPYYLTIHVTYTYPKPTFHHTQGYSKH